MQPLPVPASPNRSVNRIIPPQPFRAGMVMLTFVAMLYLIEFIDAALFHGGLDRYGIVARSVPGLSGIIWAPLLHLNWAHLAGNTVPVLLFGFLAMAGGLGQWIVVTTTIWLVSGIGVWLLADPGSNTVGASGLAFGWLAFLLVRGLFNGSFKQILVGLILLFYWGSVLWGLLPGNPEISWQGHLFGALAGILAAWLASRANRGRATPTRLAPGDPTRPLPTS